MARIAKPTGRNSSQASRGTDHGSKAAKRLARMQGSDNYRDGKPNGFLARRDKPATGRARGGPQ